jgi:hypothetical protein
MPISVCLCCGQVVLTNDVTGAVCDEIYGSHRCLLSISMTFVEMSESRATKGVGLACVR